MVCVAKFSSSVHSAVGDKQLPASRDEDVVQCFPVPACLCPMVDLFLRKPGVRYTEVAVVAEKEEAATIVVCSLVDEGCADR